MTIDIITVLSTTDFLSLPKISAVFWSKLPLSVTAICLPCLLAFCNLYGVICSVLAITIILICETNLIKSQQALGVEKISKCNCLSLRLFFYIQIKVTGSARTHYITSLVFFFFFFNFKLHSRTCIHPRWNFLCIKDFKAKRCQMVQWCLRSHKTLCFILLG